MRQLRYSCTKLAKQCRNCKAKKVKCGEEKPRCLNCDRNGDKICDYSIRLNWDGRAKRKGTSTPEPMTPEFLSDSGTGVLNFRQSTPFSRSSSDHGSLGEIDPAAVLAELPFSGRDSAQPSPQFSKFKGYVPPNSTPRSEPRPSTAGSNKRKSQQDDLPLREQDYFNHVGTENGASSHSNGDQPFKKTRYSSDTSPSESWSAPNPSMVAASTPDSGTSLFSPYTTFQNSVEGTYEPLSAKPSNDEFVTPARPAAVPHESQWRSHANGTAMHIAFNEPRRLSVNSLLIQEEAQAQERRGHYRRDSENSVFYGIDRGLPDRDIPDNNDAHILDVVTPTFYNAEFGDSEGDVATEFGFGLSSNKVASYENDLHVRIAKSLHPLPTILHANPMNLMYFHFFIERTARILVPHDCPANPFKVILPQSKASSNPMFRISKANMTSGGPRRWPPTFIACLCCQSSRTPPWPSSTLKPHCCLGS